MARGFANKSAARQWVWDKLSAEGVARFRFPPHGRIPNFAGAEVTAARLLDIEPGERHSRQGQPGFTACTISRRILPNCATIDRDDHIDSGTTWSKPYRSYGA